ncbi:hypothetical protein [Neorhodopirellula pilleata]|uniref:Transmembrane protein n=1 Tax=Neorhodopirellula pilleata TaxID=2714738 RepID=A0A5C6A6E5_9BACT|nr:hypothetical protein [Neorhodopirellula pilleata]TWT95026.1 hypothetical protein Pla100_36050 [Neorhodopirellula pilleata]
MNEPFFDDTVPLDDLLRNAGNYIRPRDELRASILECVRDGVDRKHRRRRWFFSFSAASGVMAMTLVVGGLGLSLVPRGRTADELFSQATRRAHVARQTNTIGVSESGTSWQWALSEVFADWRRVQR